MLSHVLDQVCRREAGHVLATLIRRLGDFDLAEDALQDAIARALERWPAEGIPDNPAAWLTTVARRRSIDLVRRRKPQAELAELADDAPGDDIGPATISRIDHDRPPPPRLHLLPPRAGPPGASGSRPAHPRGTFDARDRPRLRRAGGNDRPAVGAGEAKNPRRPNPIRSA